MKYRKEVAIACNCLQSTATKTGQITSVFQQDIKRKKWDTMGRTPKIEIIVPTPLAHQASEASHFHWNVLPVTGEV